MMRRREASPGLIAVVVALLLPAPALAQQTLSATVSSTPTGAPSMASGFVGVSLEYRALHVYTGRNPLAVNPVLIHLLQHLAPGQAPIVRIGGESADASWWPIKGVIPPGGIDYTLTEGWLRLARAFAADLGGSLIMGVNLAAGRPSFAVAEARAFLKGIGRPFIDALEIGNEPDIYNVFPWYRDRNGHTYYARGRNYDFHLFAEEFSRWRAALPSLPIAGPAFAELSWLVHLGRFLANEPGLHTVTLHRYPLRAGVQDPSAPNYASIPNLLADQASRGLAQSIAPYVAVAHAHGDYFRLDEINSASHRGQPGVSDAFASALWALDTLFNLASVGVQGVNFHSLPGAAYELFTFHQQGSTWHAFVHPEYYGMMMFAQAFPPGSQLLQVSAPNTPLKVWADQDPSGTLHVELINKDPSNAYTVTLHLPGASTDAQEEQLLAPSVSSKQGVTLGGQTFGTDTTTGDLPPPVTSSVAGVGGTYVVPVPAGSAALLTK